MSPIDWAGLVVAPCIAAFGDTVVTYAPVAGGSYTFTGVFDRSFLSQIINDAEFAGSARQPVMGMAAADLAVAPVQGDRFTVVSTTSAGVVPGDQYIVKEPRPDGHGHILLMLQEFDATVVTDARVTDDGANRIIDDGSDRETN